MKRIKRLLLFIAIFALLGTAIPVNAAKIECNIAAEFPEPFTVKISGSSFATESEEKIYLLMNTAYSAYVLDDPLSSMWSDINNSSLGVNYNVTSHESTEGTAVGVEGTIVGNDSYSSPYQMVSAVKDFVKKFPVQGKTMYEKVKCIHDYLCDRITYDENAKHAYSAYGALIDKKAVCEGYAESFMLLCHQNNIDCILVNGYANNGRYIENHMWNYVKMDDNRWYAVDVTWDDTSKLRYSHFLVGSKTVTINNEKFESNHAPSSLVMPDKINFRLPTLSDKAYSVNNPSLVGSKASSYKVTSLSYYGSLLGKNEKAFYNALMKMPVPKGSTITIKVDTSDFPTAPQATTAPSTTKPQTTKAQTTTAPTTSKQAETTKKPVTTSPKETNPVTTSKPVISPVTTEKGIETSPHSTSASTTSPVSTSAQDTNNPASSDVNTESSGEQTASGTGSKDESSGETMTESISIVITDSSNKEAEPTDTASDTDSPDKKPSDDDKTPVNPIVIASIAGAVIVLGIVALIIKKKHK